MTTHQPRAPRSAPNEGPGVDWIRRNRLTAGIIACALGAILGAVIIIAAGSGTPAGHPAKLTPKAPATKGSRWVDGTANTDLNAVNAALIALTNARTRGNAHAATAAGTRLVDASATALRGAMPPVDVGVYRTALGNLIRAGHDAATGKLAAATPLINDGIAGLTTVTASANAPKVP